MEEAGIKTCWCRYYFRLLYDPALDAHFTTEVYTSHNGIVLDPYPESPARTRAVWAGLVEAGIPEAGGIF